MLGTFQSGVVASIGMTGAALVGALVAMSGGRYSGLCIRKEREKHGTRRLIEGVADQGQTVVFVDDCIRSGNSLKEACSALEAEGFAVEGAVAVASFPWSGGIEWAQSMGYRVETLFDIWKDLKAGRDWPPAPAASAPLDHELQPRVPDGLTPADVARWVAQFHLTHGKTPVAPEFVSGDFDAAGGVVVSFRDRSTGHRIARNGFVRFEHDGHSIGEDVVRATAETVRAARKTLTQYGLDRLKVAVTFFGPHEEIGLSGLDFTRYGVLVRSSVSPLRHGAALPNTQFFTSEIEQFRHARFTNAKLTQVEPFILLRHQVTKSVETGCSWPAFGVSSSPPEPGDGFGAAVLCWVRELLHGSNECHEVWPCPLPPESQTVLGVAVSFYQLGMVGCGASFDGDMGQMVRGATKQASADERYAAKKAGLIPDDLDIVVSVFYDCESLGEVNADLAARTVRLGKDSLFATNGNESAIMLAHIPVQYDWSKTRFAESVMPEANTPCAPRRWTTYATKSWLSRGGIVFALDAGYPVRPQSAEAGRLETVRQIASYIANQFDASGFPSYSYQPVMNQTTARGASVRPILALEALLDASTVLDDPAFEALAKAGLHRFCEAISNSGPSSTLSYTSKDISAAVALVSAVYRTGDSDLLAHPGLSALRRRIDVLFHDDGVISALPRGHRMNLDHDILPGQALRMAARIAAIEGLQSLPNCLSANLCWYRRRFRLQHPWGMVWWQLQGWAAIYSVTADSEPLPFLYEIADWALQNQLQVNGAFVVDYAPNGPGFHTACILEGLADAWLIAISQGDRSRSTAYEDAWRRGTQFMERLICRPEDTFAMPSPEKCIGGVRASLTTSSFRIDYAAHTLSAVCKGLRTLSSKVPETAQTRQHER